MHFRGSSRYIGITLFTAALCVVGGSVTGSPSALATSTKVAPPPTAQPSPTALGTGSSAAKTGSNDPDTKGLTVQVNSMHRDSAGLVTLVWTLTNSSGSDFNVYNDLGSVTSQYFGNSVSQVQLTDNTQKIRFYPLMDTHTYCVCSAGDLTLKSGSRIQLYDMFKTNPDTKTVDVEIKGFQPVKNMSIS